MTNLSMFLSIFCGVVLGMASVFVAFVLFKPILQQYIDAMVRNQRINEDTIVEKMLNRTTIPTMQREKAQKSGVFKPKRDADEDVK
jgi:uncharacterized membrane protein